MNTTCHEETDNGLLRKHCMDPRLGNLEVFSGSQDIVK